MTTITHYGYGDNEDAICLACAAKQDPAELEACTGSWNDYDDEDQDGRDLECTICGEYVFPDGQADKEAEYNYYAREYRSGRLGESIGKTGDARWGRGGRPA